MLKMLKCVLVLASLLCLTAETSAWGVFATTKDTSFAEAVRRFGSANWWCVKSMASGACGAGPFVAYLDQVCDGMTDDSIAAWTLDGIANNPTMTKLYFPPGSICTNTHGTFGTTDGGCSTPGTQGVMNAVWWGYGASVNRAQLGNCGIILDSLRDAYIATANIGDTTVTVTDGNISRFAVGDWIMVNGLCIQVGGVPTNQNYFEFRQITGISGNVISFTEPLKNYYSDNWPFMDFAPIQGPAAIYNLLPSWPATMQVFGLTFKADIPGYQYQFQNSKRLRLEDITITDNNADMTLSVVESGTVAHSKIFSFEVDKQVTNMVLFYSNASSIIRYQSASVDNAVHDWWYGTVHGWAKFTRFTNGFIGQMINGPGFGHGVSAFFDNMYVNAVLPSNTGILPAWVSYSAGVFSVDHSDIVAFRNTMTVAVPGALYGFADSDGTFNSSPLTTFTIGTITDDGSFVYLNLSQCSWGCSNALPTPSCNGHSCPLYANYPAGGPGTIVQRNLPAGSIDMTQYQGP